MSQYLPEETQATAERMRAKSSSDQDTQSVNESEVHFLAGQSHGVTPQDLIGTGFTYRHDWGDKNGWWTLNLNWGAVTANSRVFVAIGEGAPGGGKIVGAARYTLYNVAPNNGVVSIRVHIDWGSPLRLYADYLVINP